MFEHKGPGAFNSSKWHAFEFLRANDGRAEDLSFGAGKFQSVVSETPVDLEARV